jgi:hypothetical protein
VRIADCVHPCAFRYGRDEFNPYENYVAGLARGRPRAELRARIFDFLRHYRPADVGEALGVATSRRVPLWQLPWKSWRKLVRPGGWTSSLEDVLDLLTYFCPQGIRWTRVAEEFHWLERSWHAISREGYRPERYGYIEVFELADAQGSSFLVLDGNHRLASLHAAGAATVLVRRRPFRVARRRWAAFWPLVLSGHVSLDDARTIFDAFRRGNANIQRAPQPAALLDEHDRPLAAASMEALLLAPSAGDAL